MRKHRNQTYACPLSDMRQTHNICRFLGFNNIKGRLGCAGNPEPNGFRVINNSIFSRPLSWRKLGNPPETLWKPSETPAETPPETLPEAFQKPLAAIKKPASQQANKPASQQASQPASQQASKPASQQASPPASQPASKPASQPAVIYFLFLFLDLNQIGKC